MADKTKIEWTRGADGSPGATWNPITGCSVVSPGCTNCYAMRLAGTRLQHHPSRTGLTVETKAGPVWNGTVRFNEEWLTQPLKWSRPRMIFVCAHGDLFHESVPDAWIDRVFAVMALAPQHTFQILTKRSARMRVYLSATRAHPVGMAAMEITFASLATNPRSAVGAGVKLQGDIPHLKAWPLPNVWLGVSAEDQRRADERVPDLLATPAAVRCVSAEPLLGPIDFTNIGGPGSAKAFGAHGADVLSPYNRSLRNLLDWIVVGGEAGPNARPLWTPDVRSIVRQCQAASVPVFVKQLGTDVRDRNDAGFEGCEPHEWPDVDPDDVEHDLDGTRDGYQGAPVRIRLRSRKGGDPSEWPADLRVREMPHAG